MAYFREVDVRLASNRDGKTQALLIAARYHKTLKTSLENTTFHV